MGFVDSLKTLIFALLHDDEVVCPADFSHQWCVFLDADVGVVEVPHAAVILRSSMASVNPLPRAGFQNQDFPGIVVYAVDDPVVPADPDASISEVPRPPHLPGSGGLWVLAEPLDCPEHPLIFTARKAAHGLAGSSGEDHLVQVEAPYPFSPGSSPASRSLFRSSSISWTASSSGRSPSSPRAMASRVSSAALRSARSSRASIRRSYSRTSRITPMRSPFSSVT